MPADPWSTEIDKFLALLLASRLISIKKLKEACLAFGHNAGAKWNNDDLPALCECLVTGNSLTFWQCKMLLKGQYKGFFLDEYKLLDYLESEESEKIYLAEDRTLNRQVRLRVTPPIIISGQRSKPYYEVEEL
jgi:hypothetical protein